MKFGPLKEIWLASYAPFYAFVVYRSRQDAQAACEGADGEWIAGRKVRVGLQHCTVNCTVLLRQVSLALPRNRGPRNRFIVEREDSGYRGDYRDYREYRPDYGREYRDRDTRGFHRGKYCCIAG